MADHPFVDYEHQARFEEGRAEYRRGGPMAPLCGATSRVGGLCRHAPLEGHNRCLRHAGPKAARAHRQRQFEAMQAGKISYAEFAKAEAKRAANRLRDQWKKNPWISGSTVDLGEHEMPFQGDMQHWVGADRAIPPAVMDWLRWRYRRFQIDRSKNEDWATLLRDELPRRLRDAGAAPPGWSEAAGEVPAWGLGDKQPSYKRTKVDATRPLAAKTTTRLPLSSKSVAQHLRTHAASIWDKPPAEVTTADVLKILGPIWSTTPETARRTAGRIERILNAARAAGLRSGDNPAQWRGHLSLLLPKLWACS